MMILAQPIALPSFALVLALGLALPTDAHAQSPTQPIPKGSKVTLGRPTQVDEVLLRLVGLECIAATALKRNPDGSYDGSLTCGAVTIAAKRLAIDLRDVVIKEEADPPPSPLSDPTIATGKVTILEIGEGDLFKARRAELIGKFCNVTKPLKRDAAGYYAGELTCGNNRYYFAEVRVAAGSVRVPALLEVLVGGAGASVGERWRITDAGDIYPSINTTDCLVWPSADAKRTGGENAWGGWRAKNGDVGTVIGVARHCSQDVNVVFLQIGAFVVAIGEQGLAQEP